MVFTRDSRLAVALLLWLVAGRYASSAETSTLSAANEHRLHGRYASAREVYQKLIATAPVDQRPEAIAGLAECHAAVGDWREAITLLERELKQSPDAPDLWGRLAEYQFETGRWEAARESASQGLRRDTDALRARLILAHLHREAGALDEALEGYRWFVRYYNRAQPRDAERLRLVAEGSLEYARWKRVTSVFNFVVNTLCPDALKDNPQNWRISVLSGDLLLEKYNRTQALPEFEAALAINPFAAEAHAALGRAALQDRNAAEARAHADRALDINPRLVSALIVRADAELLADKPEAAATYIERAEQVHPRDQEVLAGRAILQLLAEGLPSASDLQGLLVIDSIGPHPRLRSLTSEQASTPFASLLGSLIERNPRPGRFLTRLGEFFESRWKYPQAEHCYRAAVRVMPQTAAARTNLGLLAMRTGKIAEAEQQLADAFKADPFHVRVSNMRKVLDVLNGYETIRTEHFVVRVDTSDHRLGEAMAEYLEEVHTQLSQQFGYEPAEPTQFEIYNQARGQSAHQWFSARMIGLPWIQTIGASTGRIVAMTSPLATDQPFHWGRVLRHEYVHILTLQQTDFNIPHWFTEALAVQAEELALPEVWKRLLIQRLSTDELFTLRTINEGFRRPTGRDDWTLAYCQSRLYADFLEQSEGPQAHAALLHAYREGQTTEQAIQTVSGKSLEQFEADYRKWVEDLVAEIVRSQSDPVIKLEVARQEFLANPRQAAPLGRYAYAVWKADEPEEARSLAQEALRIEPHEPLATAVLANIDRTAGDVDAAVGRLVDAFDPQQPHPVTLALMGELALERDDLDSAARLYRIGTESFPLEETFWKGLAVALLRIGDDEKTEPVLVELAQREGDSVAVRRKLAEIAAERGDHEQARRWAREVLFIDFDEAEAHALLGQASLGLEQFHRARVEFEQALEFDERCHAARLGLARLERRQGNLAEALQQVRMVLEADPGHHEARALQQELEATDSPDPSRDMR